MIFPLKGIPDDLWKKAKHIAIEQGISMRILIFRAIKMYLESNPKMSCQQFDAPIDDIEAKKMAKAALDIMKESMK
jgi:hypothetical protein